MKTVSLTDPDHPNDEIGRMDCHVTPRDPEHRRRLRQFHVNHSGREYANAPRMDGKLSGKSSKTMLQSIYKN